MTTHFIVTPVRNAVRTIDATIWSIVSQLGDLDIRYHVQDGGSTDGTLDRIQAWAARIEQMSNPLIARVHFTFDSRPDSGMYDAITSAFSKMAIPSDAFMNWCNADDALWPGALEAVSRIGKDLPDTEWITGWPAWFDNLNRFSALDRTPRYPHALIAAGLADGIHWPFIQQESSFWRKRLWDKAGGLDTSLRLAGDWDLWVRFAQSTPLVHVHRQLGAFYMRPGQQSTDMSRYRSEMDSKLGLSSRKRALRPLVMQSLSLTTVPVAMEDDSSRWQLTYRNCSRRAGLLAFALRSLPMVTPNLSKLFYKIW